MQDKTKYWRCYFILYKIPNEVFLIKVTRLVSETAKVAFRRRSRLKKKLISRLSVMLLEKFSVAWEMRSMGERVCASSKVDFMSVI